MLHIKLRDLRKSRNWSQELLAEKINTSRQSISKWENGWVIPNTNHICLLSEIFEVTTEYLLKREV